MKIVAIRGAGGGTLELRRLLPGTNKGECDHTNCNIVCVTLAWSVLIVIVVPAVGLIQIVIVTMTMVRTTNGTNRMLFSWRQGDCHI